MSAHVFRDYGEAVVNLVTNKPDGWEYLLTVELLKEFLREPLRRWRELQAGIYVSPRIALEEDEVLPWVQDKLSDARNIATSFAALYSTELQKSWGKPGVAGDEREILDVIRSIGRTANQAVDWEVDAKFRRPPEHFIGLVDVMSGAVGFNLPRLREAVEIMETGLQAWQQNPDAPATIAHTIMFDVPPGWNERVEAEISLLKSELGI